ncbi:DNA polymerase III subunit delta [Pseudoflavonifractor sp. 524-17]|uniref:DNA polymerase III subunit n=1 Tax=Pseudoflavonifractor sp. 524-17 TaxID=2304577 RepID=UPI0013795EC2|nr:DNA polymerase III subunit delta [Pseudoflavonifractor sp. 524-17]NCE63829.1 DNA polymerase III subunit delta [Pseudoflavonifractor sp. 524-17]
MDLHTLAGNAPLKRRLERETALRGLSHAYILTGPAGSGKHTLARVLAAALVCSAPGDGPTFPCGRCSGCKKAAADIHPDIIQIGEEGKDITVAQVRALRAGAYIRPNEARRKVYLIPRAHTMNPSAQNAMLKLLEEGPPYAAFLLLAENAAALLPTVRSRCELLSLSPVAEPEGEAFLRARYPDRPREEIRAALSGCEGNLGRAIHTLEGGQADTQIPGTAALLVRRLAGGDELALADLCISLEKWDRDKFSALLEEAILLLRDGLLTHAGVPCRDNPEGRECAALLAQSLPPAALMDAISLLEELRTACGFYVGTGHLAGWLCAQLHLLASAAPMGG